MSILGDYLHDAGWYLGKARTSASNAAYRTTRPWRSLTGEVRNRRNRRTVARGRRPLAERVGSRISARIPLWRSRINPATGRPHRDDAAHGRLTDQSLARLRDAHAQRLMPAHSPRDSGCCHTAPARSAERVLGRGTAARVQAAMRQANSNPWDVPRQPGRPR